MRSSRSDRYASIAADPVRWRRNQSGEPYFTAETQRGAATTESRNISRKGAKAAKKKMFEPWRSWRLGASKSP